MARLGHLYNSIKTLVEALRTLTEAIRTLQLDVNNLLEERSETKRSIERTEKTHRLGEVATMIQEQDTV